MFYPNRNLLEPHRNVGLFYCLLPMPYTFINFGWRKTTQMKKLLLSVFAISAFLLSQAQVNTLRHYDIAKATFEYPATFKLYVARFEPEFPGELIKIKIMLGGEATGTAKVHVFGHEGGTAFPQLEKDLITPIDITKTQAGIETIEVTLPASVRMTNNQFFITLSDIKNGATVVAENSPPTPTCQSGSGGDYYYCFLKSKSDQWSVGSRQALAIDAIINYDYTDKRSYLKDITMDAGVDATLNNRSIACADINKDGFYDLLVRGTLYIYNKSKGYVYYDDMTANVGLSGTPQASAFIDMDNDGDLDILFLGVDSLSYLYTNEGGGTFIKKELTNIPKLVSVSSYSIGDIDGDNYPDLFIGQLWGTYPEALPNFLMLNDGAGGFTDVSERLYPGNPPARRSRGSQFVDYDNDGDLDLYVTNYYLEIDELYNNQGDGTFYDAIYNTTIDQNQTGSNHGTGVDWSDYDNDGDMDLLLSQFAHPPFVKQYDHRATTIYRNELNGGSNVTFTDTRDDNGIELEETFAGCSWGDINNDGLQDIMTTVFYGCRYVDIYMQKPDNTFEIRTQEFGVQNITTGTDAAWIDLNNDGKLDLIAGEGNKVRLWLNQAPFYNNFVSFDLVSTSTNSQAIGARAYVYANGKTYMQEVSAGRGQNIQKPARLHFGLAQANMLDSIIVVWPNGVREKFNGIDVNNHYRITEGGDVQVNTPTITQEQLELGVYPNPFTSGVTFNFTLPYNAEAELCIYNLLGEKVAALTEGNLSKGNHTLNWEANNLTKGMYFYRLTINGQVMNGKVVRE